MSLAWRLFSLAGLSFLAACVGTTTGSSTSSSSSGGVEKVDCQSVAGAVSLCDIQNPQSSQHPAPSTEVTLPEPVTVVSTVFELSRTNGNVIKAFFVVEGQGGPFRGAMVKGTATQVDDLALVIGSKVSLTVRVEEFAGSGVSPETETQLSMVSGNKVGSVGVAPGPKTVAVGVFGSGATGEPYEGILVKVENVTAARFSNGAVMRYGAFRLDGGLLVDDQLFAYGAGVGETFSQITGFVRLTFDGEWQLIPRDEADITSSGNPRSPRNSKLNDVQDPANLATLPHCIAPDECDPLRFEKLIVTTGPRGANKNSAGKFNLFSVYAQDPTLLDSNNEPLPYSAVRLVFSRPNTPGLPAVDTGYDMPVRLDDERPDTADASKWPQIGDVIEVVGTAQEYFDNTQVGSITKIRKVGSVAEGTAPMAGPKTFTGEANLSQLAGGRSAAAMCVDRVQAASGAEQWEGALVKLTDVTTTLACVPTAGTTTTPPSCISPDRGYFQVTGNVEIGTGLGVFFTDICGATTCTCAGPDKLPNDRRMLGKVYTSITGVFDYSFDVFRVNPRSNADLVAAP